MLKRTLVTKDKNLLGWLGKERDNESNLGDHGVRKYEAETGRFTSIDPLWGKYYGWTPYQYSMNSPAILVDLGGMVVEALDANMQNGIKSNIEAQYRNYVTFIDNTVNINLTENELSALSNDSKFANSNFDKLTKMSKSEQVFTLKSVDFSKDKFTRVMKWSTNSLGEKYMSSSSYESLKDIQETEGVWMEKVGGIFLGAENRNITSKQGTFLSPASASGKNEIYIDKKANTKKAVSHELFEGHAWYYFNGWDHGETNVFGK